MGDNIITNVCEHPSASIPQTLSALQIPSHVIFQSASNLSVLDMHLLSTSKPHYTFEQASLNRSSGQALCATRAACEVNVRFARQQISPHATCTRGCPRVVSLSSGKSLSAREMNHLYCVDTTPQAL